MKTTDWVPINRDEQEGAVLEWIIGLAVSALVIWLMVKNKAFRYVVLGLVALIVAAGWAWYEKTQADERRAYSLIPPGEIEFRDARLSTGSSSRMTVTIKNNSVHRLSSVEATIMVFDCLAGQFITPQCEAVGQSAAYFGTAIPAGQVRAGEAYVRLSALPPLRGEMKWYHQIDRVRAATP